MQVNFQDIVDIYEKEVKLNTKNKRKIYYFERFKMQNFTKIFDTLSNNKYNSINYNIFMIRSPKYRIIMSLSVNDKIINHYITRFILMPKLEKYLDIRNIATRKNKGRDLGIKMVKKYIEHFKTKETCYVLKLDISKYFYSIDHNILKNMIKDKFSKEEFDIIEATIDSTNKPYINEQISNLKTKELEKITKRRKEVEDIPLYTHNKGLPIGNMSSQFLSIYYLNALDHKIVHDYHLKYYVRYMDDLLIFHESKEYLKEIKNKIEKELNDNYALKLNNKKSLIVNIKDGVTFCGYRFRVINKKTVINICSGTKERVKKRIKEINYLYKNDKITLQKAFSSINTYYNGFKYGSHKKMKRLVDKYFFG